MDRDTLLKAVKAGPFRVFMNDGTWFDIPSSEMCLIDQISARLLHQEDDIWKT
jgi:hypothetical protein